MNAREVDRILDDEVQLDALAEWRNTRHRRLAVATVEQHRARTRAARRRALYARAARDLTLAALAFAALAVLVLTAVVYTSTGHPWAFAGFWVTATGVVGAYLAVANTRGDQ